MSTERTQPTPVERDHRPGLTVVPYRVGTHGRFKDSMLMGLSSAQRPGLVPFNTRDDSDFSIALLDSWAVVADVLTFYQERMVNEAFLGTASERLSVRQLARLIGYELRPGKAATAFLAFALDTADGSPEEVRLEHGVRVDSIPGPGEQLQSYETVEPITARPEWNAMRPRLQRPQPLSQIDRHAVLQGLGNNIELGDRHMLLQVNDSGTPSHVLKTVVRVEDDLPAQTTTVSYAPRTLPFLYALIARPRRLFQLQPAALTHNWIAASVPAVRWKQSDLRVQLAHSKVAPAKLKTAIRTFKPLVPTSTDELPKQPGLYAFRERASIFGHNVPPLPTNSPTPRADCPAYHVPSGVTQPGNTQINSSQRYLYLDAEYAKVVRGSWIALKPETGVAAFYQVLGNETVSHKNYGMSAKVSKLELSVTGTKTFHTRTTSVYCASEMLELAPLPILEEVKGDEIELDGPYLELEAGLRVIVSGDHDDLAEVTEHELHTVKDAELVAGFTVLTLEKPLRHTYKRTTARVCANVAMATHGATLGRVLGSGDSQVLFQRFPLPEIPLTYASAATPSGGKAELEVRVDAVRWHEVSNFLHAGPEDRVYAIRHEEDGTTYVQFGDGISGARVPTGLENVTATYRKGNELEGLVGPDQLSLLAIKPQGVKGVTNPLAAYGAADGEELDDARSNSPVTVLTLGRVVSLEDFAQFTRAFAAFAKAHASWVWTGARRTVLLTVAGPKGAEVPSDSVDIANLVDALRSSGDASIPVVVRSYEPAYFQVDARIAVDPDHVTQTVLQAAEQRLRDAYSFKARAFGEPVFRSDVIATLQSTPGVIAVDLNLLFRSETAESERSDPNYLRAHLPREGTRVSAGAGAPVGEDMKPAELLVLDPRPVKLESMA